MAKNNIPTPKPKYQGPARNPSVQPAYKKPAPVAPAPVAKTFTSKPVAKPVAQQADFIFGKRNYQWMVGGLVVIAFGFVLMSGTKDIMNPVKIVLAPVVVLAGFALEFVAILIRPDAGVKKDRSGNNEPTRA